MDTTSTENNRFPFPSSMKIKNYKCFGPDKYVGFKTVKPFNVLIGKNNSGKSTLIDLVQFCLSSPDEINKLTDLDPILECEIVINEKSIEKELASIKSVNLDNFIDSRIHSRDVRQTVGEKMIFQKDKRSVSPAIENFQNNIVLKKIHERNKEFHKHFHFVKIAAERDIKPEQQTDENLQVSANGVGATQLIHAFLHFSQFNPKLVSIDLLKAFNEIVSPEIQFKNISTRKLSAHENIWEVYFEDENGTLIPLSKMGSGIKTILQVLIALFLSPDLHKVEKHALVYAFEELENNLHPSMLRKLTDYLIEYQNLNSCHFFSNYPL